MLQQLIGEVVHIYVFLDHPDYSRVMGLAVVKFKSQSYKKKSHKLENAKNTGCINEQCCRLVLQTHTKGMVTVQERVRERASKREQEQESK